MWILQRHLRAVERLMTGRIRWWQTWGALLLSGATAANYLISRATFALVVFLWTLGVFLFFLFSEDEAA